MKRNTTFLGALLLSSAIFANAQGFKLKAPIATKPAMLTSVGQSADLEMVKVLLKRGNIAFSADPQAKVGSLASSGAKTLVLAIGGSSKGLGAAGVSAEADIERAKGLVAEARKAGMKVIGLHIGGEARRGAMSDKFVLAAIPLCDYVIVVAEGNKDGLITKLCAKGKITMDSVEKIAKAGEPLMKAFK
jgi:hypothetical protein